MAYDMSYGHRTYNFFYTMLCIGPHSNCIHDIYLYSARDALAGQMTPAGRHLHIPDNSE